MTLKKLQLFFVFYIVFILIITAFFYFAIYSTTSSAVVIDEITSNILYGISILSTVSSVFIGSLLFNKFKKQAILSPDAHLQEKLYGQGSIIRFAMIEGALLFCVVIAFTFHLIPLLYLGATLLVYVLTLFPTTDKLKRDLNRYN